SIQQHRHRQYTAQGMTRLIPGNRNPKTADGRRDVLLSPDGHYIEDLRVSDRLKYRDRDYDNKRADDAPIRGGEPVGLTVVPLHPRRQIAVSVEVSGKAKEHEDRG